MMSLKAFLGTKLSIKADNNVKKKTHPTAGLKTNLLEIITNPYLNPKDF